MQQFSLEKWLKDKSRKVLTRDGREVEILKTDFRGYKQIVGVVKNRDNKDDEVEQWDGQGNFRGLFGESKYDLFFADEEEELTEFENYIKSLLEAFGSQEGYRCTLSYESVKRCGKELLALARKELEANYYTKVVDDRVVFKSDLHDRDLQTAYDMGKQDTLKDLPKWKKAKENLEFSDNVVKMDEYGNILCFDIVWVGEYYIDIQSLKSLPKEE